MSLKARLVREIVLTGPMTVADYVLRCLHDPQDGYYATRPGLGVDGDFITAPMVSQMFGELVCLWAVEVWRQLGSPGRFTLVEVGPGDGTLMDDILRTAKRAPGFLEACDVVLIEPSPFLRDAQARRLEGSAVTPRWVASLDAIDAGAPVILVANEMLDCLPVRQFMRTEEGWAERCVGVDEAGDLIFGLTAAPAGFTPPPYPVEVGQIVETSPHQAQFGRDCAALMVQATGAALLIDYGRDTPGPGDTLQALSQHKAVDPLASPGEADLTQWADFPALLAAAMSAGAAVTPCIGQGDFLRAMGIEVRAARLKEARPDGAALLARQMNRLIADDEMGTLFKACAIFSPADVSVPGFET